VRSLSLGILTFLAVAGVCHGDQSPLETIPDGEGDSIRGIVTSTSASVRHRFALDERALRERKRKSQPTAMRDLHSKAHGCVKADYVPTPLDEDAPSTISQGLFAATKPLKAWIRFSNGGGNIDPDKNPDARGMAVKLFIGNELGARLPDAPETRTQDLTGVNTPFFPVLNAAEDDKLLHSVMDSPLSQSGSALFSRLGQLVGLTTHIGGELGTLQGKLAIESTKAPKVFNPLQIQYWSQTPYQLGTVNDEPQAMKYSFAPCAGQATDDEKTQKAHKKKENGLRVSMRDQLATRGACFDVLVQLRPGLPTDIENTIIEWKTTFYKVAELRIRPQNFLSAEQKRFCEDLSFNPRNSLIAHKPLGWANRVRAIVYRAISILRHGLNQRAVAEPSGDEDFTGFADEAKDSEWK
jgi:hypothetical protein